MPTVYVMSVNGKCLMPTNRCGHIRHPLKDGKAKIVSRHPFTIQLLYESWEYTQPLEIGVDSGYIHVGVSVKSRDRESFSAEFDLLTDEKSRHDDCRRYRRTRRNRLRYRKCQFDKDTKPKGWIAPSLRHKAEAQVRIVENICKVAPVQKVTVEVGEFDPALLKAMQTGKDIPKGIDYQHGPLYFADSLRAAVFQRDEYTCKVCGLSTIPEINKKNAKDPKKKPKKKGPIPNFLHEHHARFWKGRHADTLQELITVCNHCHTATNHQPGGILWGLEPNVPRLEAATFMNIVRWFLINRLRVVLHGIAVCHVYGAETSRKRKDAGLEKTHATDALCIGDFLPAKHAESEHYQKRCRNNRILEKFYDAKYIDIRDGSKKSGKDLGCNRTNRREARNSEKNLRMFHGKKVAKGQRRIRKNRYAIQAGDKILAKGKVYPSNHGCISGGTSVLILNAKESPTGKAVTASVRKVVVLRHCGGWKKVG